MRANFKYELRTYDQASSVSQEPQRWEGGLKRNKQLDNIT